MIFNDKYKSIHFVGIGGISMSGLAEIMLKNKFEVSGSDSKPSNITEKLKNDGAKIYIGHNAENVLSADLVVYTAAVNDENPEIKKAKELNIPLMTRAEFLGQLMKGYRWGIAISGTHGKTTTTSMFSHIILNANLDPTILVGGELDIINGNVRSGNTEYFITEACEYKESFLSFCPNVGIILNIEADHLDYYKDINEIENAFKKFSNLIPKDGYIIGCAEDHRVLRVLSTSKAYTLTYGINNGQIRAKNIVYNNLACASFDVCEVDEEDETFEKLFSIKLNVPGKHNVLNSLAAISASLCLGIDPKYIVEGLLSYGGTHKRFEYKGERNGVIVIDDYAHHPTEIKACLETAKNLKHNKIVCVFQPHTFSRTKLLFNDFVNCFNDANELIVMDIYSAREKDDGTINSKMLSDEIERTGVKCKTIKEEDEIIAYLNDILYDGDILLTIGAGEAYKIGEKFLKR